MILICGLDFETTGLDPKEDRVIEVGAVLWDWERSLPLRLMSELVSGNPVSEEITALTGIDNDLLTNYGEKEDVVFSHLCDLIDECDYVMAHNGTTFDKLFFDETMKRIRFDGSEKPWLDTKIDIVYPASITTRNLRHLASEHQFLNPFAHRAVFDVLTMLKVASNYPITNIIERANEPTLFVQALVSFDEKELAKARGYYWCAPKKIWWRSMKSSDYEIEKQQCGFRTQLLAAAPE